VAEISATAHLQDEASAGLQARAIEAIAPRWSRTQCSAAFEITKSNSRSRAWRLHQPLRKPPAGNCPARFESSRRRVDANHLGAELRDLGGELAGPATHIENALARLGISNTSRSRPYCHTNEWLDW